MKKARFVLAVAVCALCLCFANLADAAQGDGGTQYQMQPYGQYTQQQMEAAQKIFNDSYADMAQTRQALNDRQYQLSQELASPKPDKGKIEALSQEIGKLRGQMLAARTDLRKNLANQGLPPDCFGYGRPWAGAAPCGAPGWGPCWGGDNGDYRGGWYHHGRGHGHGRGGCWR